VRIVLILAAAARSTGKPLLLVSLAGWSASLSWARVSPAPEYCSAVAGWLEQGWRDIDMALVVNAPAGLLVGWLTMLAAMMPPLLARPTAHLWYRTLARRRLRGMTLLVSGYTAVWLAAGVILISIAVLLKTFLGSAPLGALPAAVAIALLWQATPVKQMSLNRCHYLPPLSAFGRAADRDALAYGLISGGWCVGACWAVMLVPLVADEGHFVLMAVSAALIIGERQLPPRAVRWRFPAHLSRVLVASAPPILSCDARRHRRASLQQTGELAEL
jgi:predicted metal-binding membrane protein